MRTRLIALVVVLTACASASPPPGGPEVKVPPKIVRITPDTNAVNVHDENVSFQFDETINDRGTGEQEVDNFFLISPSDGRPRVYWHRNRIDIRPRRGFRPGTAYTITLLPGLTDLHGNKMKTGALLVFSTGATIPREKLSGTAFDWVGERPAPKAYMEAIAQDSTVYIAQADSLGRFSIGPLVPGSYLVRAIIDANNNRILDRNEAFDTLRVTVPQSAPAELLTAARDTLPARILTVSVQDSMRLSVTFDRLLDPRQTLSPQLFRLLSADSTPVPISSATSARQDKIADSVAAVAATKARTDSINRADSAAGKPPIPVAPPPAAIQPARGKAPPPPPPKPSLPPPFTSVTLKLGQALPPNKVYRVSATGVRALSGRTAPSDRSFTTPKPPPPPKVTPKDSAALKPVAPPGAPGAPVVVPPKVPPSRQ